MANSVKIAVSALDTTLVINDLKVVVNNYFVKAFNSDDANTILKLNIPLASLPFLISIDGYIDSNFEKDQLAKAKILKYVEKAKVMIIAYEKLSSEMDDSFR